MKQWIQTPVQVFWEGSKTSYLHNAVTDMLQVDNVDFHVDKTVAAAPGSSAGIEIAVDVTYEPSQIGESRGTLVLSSPIGGDYVVPLFGTCGAAKPQVCIHYSK